MVNFFFDLVQLFLCYSIDIDGKDDDDDKIAFNADLSTSGNEIENLEVDFDSRSSGSSKSINYDVQRIRNISSQLSMNRHMMNRHMTNSEAQTDMRK